MELAKLHIPNTCGNFQCAWGDIKHKMNARGWLNYNKRHGKLYVVNVNKQQAVYMYDVLVIHYTSFQ